VTEERTFPAAPESLHEIRSFVIGAAERAGLGAHAFDVALATTEAAANAILHSGTRHVAVRVQAAPDRFVVEVVDDGVYRRRLSVPELDGRGHRGIGLMAAVMDEVSISRGTASRPGASFVRRAPLAGRRGCSGCWPSESHRPATNHRAGSWVRWSQGGST
jgi:anti-sigma regulatory factor (Ser/Thr protein kinase)